MNEIPYKFASIDPMPNTLDRSRASTATETVVMAHAARQLRDVIQITALCGGPA